MNTYSLRVLFDSASVMEFHKTNQKLVLVKGMDGFNNELAWISLMPFEQNSISWQSSYGLYASCSGDNNQIEKTSFTTANPKQCYVFANGSFSQPIPDPNLADDMYEARNNEQAYKTLTFGLTQDVSANGNMCEARPINAVQVFFQESAIFVPHERVKVFMQSDQDDDLISTKVKSVEIELDFSHTNEVVIKYDFSLGRFVLM